MKQRYHTIIKPESTGWFVGWVEEIPGTISQGKTLTECRRNLRDALELMVETHRDEARLGLDPHCILESIEIDVVDPTTSSTTSDATQDSESPQYVA
jgi:predicted RNase H-like HicB family nuclease